MSDIILHTGLELAKHKQNPHDPLNPAVPRYLKSKLLWVPDDARSSGVHISAGRGSGKSRMLGRLIAWEDFFRGFPVVLFDSVGGAIDNFLDKITLLPREYQQRLWPRVMYVDLSGVGARAGTDAGARGKRVVPLPLYYRLGDEPLYAISQRFIDTLRRTDPHLASASVEGLNALSRVATPLGMVLFALGYQITEAPSLLDNPDEWEECFTQALNRYPEVGPAVEFFRQEYAAWNQATRERRTQSLRTKIAPFLYSPVSRAMFGAGQPGIDWEKVVRSGYAVLLDSRHVSSLEEARFKMLWTFDYLMAYVRHRGAGHRHRPISVIIDELAAMINLDPSSAHLFTADLDNLINVVARNSNIWVTIAHQQMWQFDPHIQKILLSMATQIIGSVSDLDDALILARTFFPADVHRPKRWEPVYGSIMGFPQVIDHKPVDFPVEEQLLAQAYRLHELRPFHFLARVSQAEGDITGAMRAFSIRNFDKGMWVDEELVTAARAILSRRCGVSVGTVLAEIELRLLSTGGPATISRYANNLPRTNDEEETFREEKH